MSKPCSFWRPASFCLLLASSLAAAQQNFDDVAIEVLQVRENLYMLVGSGGNITVQTGSDGVLVVDTQYAPLSDSILAKVRELSDEPLRYILNTHHHPDHTGGNANLRAAGRTGVGNNVNGATIIAHQNALQRMVTPPDGAAVPVEGLPTLTWSTPHRDLWFNGEGVRMIHQPAAHTDGDSIVYFRRSDVIATGDVYGTTMYPLIELASGGSIQGVIAAANNLIDLIIPEYGQDGGTLVIPGHGRLSDVGDVINWRDMLTITRDRIQFMIDRGMTLEEVLAARPTQDYDARWGRDSGVWTTTRFVEAVYLNLKDAGEG
ncbi:MAG: MBL fold metallo-hydrolase [Pseudohongiellaceae bacterium]